MKKIITSLICAVTFAAFAEEIRIEEPYLQLKKEFNSGKMAGKNSHAAIVGKNVYPDCWKYYYIASGDKPENFVLKPLNAISIDSPLYKKWKQPILASANDSKKFLYPAFIQCYYYQTRHLGGAYAFTNPLDKKVKLYLEGNFRREKFARAFIWIKRADGTLKLLTDDMNSAAWQTQETPLKDKVLVRHYLKLQFEEDFNPGDTLIFGAVPRDKKFGKGYVFAISGWGEKWNPVISLDVE